MALSGIGAASRAYGRRLRDRGRVVAGSLAVVLGGLVLWQGLAWLVADAILPGPAAVAGVFIRELGNGLVEHVAVSAYRVGASIALAALTAAPLGMLLGLSKPLHTFSAPLIYLSYPIPKIVLLPILLLFLGLGDEPKIAMITLILFFQVLILVRDAASAVRPELALSVRSLGAHWWDLLRFVYFPASLPALFSALRVSTGIAIAVLFFVESFGTRSGLGYYILVESWGRLAYSQMYAGVVAMALLGLALYYALDLAERRICRWVGAGR